METKTNLNTERQMNQTHLQIETGQNFMKPTQINKWKLFSNFLAERARSIMEKPNYMSKPTQKM